MKKAATKTDSTASQRITDYIAQVGDWRGPLVAQLRQLVLEAEPDMSEEWKWDTPVWTRNGLVCAAGVFKDKVKVNFFKGASLKDPKGLFNAGLDAKAMHSIDFGPGDKPNAPALKALVREAVALNQSAKAKK